jgi:hypothetical protein
METPMGKGHGAPLRPARHARTTEPKAEIARRAAELLADLETADVAAVLMVALSPGRIAAIETAVNVGVRARKEQPRG